MVWLVSSRPPGLSHHVLDTLDKATPQAEDKSHPRKPTSPGHTHWDTHTHTHTLKQTQGRDKTHSQWVILYTVRKFVSEKLHKAANPHQWECVATALRAHTTNAHTNTQWETKASSYFQDNSPHSSITYPPALCCLCRRPSLFAVKPVWPSFLIKQGEISAKPILHVWLLIFVFFLFEDVSRASSGPAVL